jgi:hypothetical protein
VCERVRACLPLGCSTNLSVRRNYPAYKGKKVSDYTNPKAPVGIVVGNAGVCFSLNGPMIACL